MPRITTLKRSVVNSALNCLLCKDVWKCQYGINHNNCSMFTRKCPHFHNKNGISIKKQSHSIATPSQYCYPFVIKKFIELTAIDFFRSDHSFAISVSNVGSAVSHIMSIRLMREALILNFTAIPMSPISRIYSAQL